MAVVGQMFRMPHGVQPNVYDRGHGSCFSGNLADPFLLQFLSTFPVRGVVEKICNLCYSASHVANFCQATCFDYN